MMGGMPMPQGQGGNMNGGMPMPNPTPSMNMSGMNNMQNPSMPNAMPAPNMAAPTPAAPAVPMPAKKNSAAEIIILVVVCLIAAAAIVIAVIFFMQWNDLKNDFDSKLSLKVAEAQSEQIKIDEENFAEREKEPFTAFSGPSDYGNIYFEYPKTWNVYVNSNGTSNTDYEAYFAASAVAPVSKQESRYALRFIIRNQSLENIQRQYDAKVTDGAVTSSSYSVNGISGTLFKGKISEGIDGQIFIAKINDKTLIMQTDSTSHFEKDFSNILAKLRRG